MHRIPLSVTLLTALANCASVESVKNLEPSYDETVNFSQKVFTACFTEKIYEILRRNYPDGSPDELERLNRDQPDTHETLALTSRNRMYSSFVADFYATGSDRTRVTMRTPNTTIAGTIHPHAIIAIEVLRDCGHVYGTGYDRPIRVTKPILEKKIDVGRPKLMTCIKDTFRGRIHGTAYLHDTDSEIWVNSYSWVPTYNDWEARFRPEGPNATHVEVRSRTGDTSEGSLTGMLLENLGKCASS